MGILDWNNCRHRGWVSCRDAGPARIWAIQAMKSWYRRTPTDMAELQEKLAWTARELDRIENEPLWSWETVKSLGWYWLFIILVSLLFLSVAWQGQGS